MDIEDWSVSEMRGALDGGDMSSSELVDDYLARIPAYARLNAIACVNERARDEARARDAERANPVAEGGARGPLHGIPVIVKDNYETVGMPTTAGSKLFEGFTPVRDAWLVARLKDAGAIILAKSNMHEFAYGITTVGSGFGATRNPYNLQCNPGGSSGGTASAIAANLAAVGMGSDTCGSIRIPAAQNNLVGIRCTQGLSSRSGIVPLSHTQDIGGPIGRSVEDVAIVLDATVGYDSADPQTAAAYTHVTPYAANLRADALEGARVGLLLDLLEVDAEDTEVADIVRRAAREMESAGATIVEVRIPGIGELLNEPGGGFLVQRADFRYDIGIYLAANPELGLKTLDDIIDSGVCHPAIMPRLLSSQSAPELESAEYTAGLVQRSRVRQATLACLAEGQLDAFMYPSVRRVAAPIGEDQPGTNCRLSANSGLPAISVPGGFTEPGMPVGVELLGAAWSEKRLLDLAYSFEAHTSHRRPPVVPLTLEED